MALPLTFAVRRAYEGPQLLIEWSTVPDAGTIVEVRLVRRLYGYPQNRNDGLVVYTGAVATAQLLSDQTVEVNRCFYYKLFVERVGGAIETSTLVQGFAITLETGFFAGKLWELLPELWKNKDKKLDQNEDGKLALTEGPVDTAEVFNLGEDGSTKKGQLRRFLKIFGPILDEAKGLIDNLIRQLDVDDATLPNLVRLAALLGLDLNTELSPEKIRNEVRLQIEFLKLKGTIPGLQARMRSVSGITAQITEQCDNILYSNDPDRTSPAFTAAERDSIGQPDDLIFYSVGYPDGLGPYWLWFNVFMDLLGGAGANQVTVRKWCLAIDEASPTCHKGFLIVRTLDDDAAGATITDTGDDEASDSLTETIEAAITDVPSDEFIADSSRWLILSDPAKTLSESGWTSVLAEGTDP